MTSAHDPGQVPDRPEPPLSFGPHDDETLPPRHEPIFNLPVVVVVVIGVLVAIHLWRLVFTPERDLAVLAEFAVIPARFALELGWFDQVRLMQDIVAGLTGPPAAERIAVARYFVDGDGARWWSLLTYGFLHAGTAHIVMNTIWLAVFGSPVARRLGSFGFLVLLVVGTVAGAATHILMHSGDVMPLVGASAGVSAATGAAARFVFSDGARFGALGHDGFVRRLEALSLSGLVRNRQAMIFVAVWFATNLLFGSGVIAFGTDEGSIAWEAHVGGFLAGLALFPVLDRRTSLIARDRATDGS